MNEYYVYIATNYRNTVLYTGVTNDPNRRAFEHRRGISPNSFSKRYRLYKIVYLTSLPTPTEAIAYEKKIKGWKREKKIKLIESENPHWRDMLPNRLSS